MRAKGVIEARTLERIAKVRSLISTEGVSAKEACRMAGINETHYYDVLRKMRQNAGTTEHGVTTWKVAEVEREESA